MAGPEGATVKVDADNNGSYEQTNTLAQGQTIYTAAANTGAHILSDKPVQVVMFTGEPGSDFGSRDTSLLPVERWSTSYYAPVSTRLGDGTVVFLYNPGASAITVSYDYRNSASSYVTATVSVPANGNARVTLTPSDGSTNFGAYRFYTTGGTPPLFYAFSATDADGTAGNNRNWDGGFTLVGRPSLTTQILVSLGIGRDPTSAVNPNENGNPIWITTVGNGHTQATVYVDYNGDNAGPLTDANSNRYDVAYSLRELQQKQLFDPDGDQSGMLVYTLNPNVKIAGAWAQDPTIAQIAEPGLDVSTLIPPVREGDAAKDSTLVTDIGGDGYHGPGDTLEYNIRVINTARSPVPGPFTVKDDLPADTTYVAGSTKYRYSVGGLWQAWVAVSDDGSGTAFPLDGSGLAVPGTLGVRQELEVVFRATIDTYANLTPGATKIVNRGTAAVTPLGVIIPLYWEDPLFGSLGDRVWNDVDADGVQDVGESGINGVIVYLDLDADGIRDAGEPWDTTAGNGDYLIPGLKAGSYLVRVDPASVAAVNTGYGPTYDLDGIATSYRATVALVAGQDRRDVDFGFRVGASVGDRVWLDRDADGVQDAGEAGLNGVRVYIDSNNNNLYDAGETNAITSGDGAYIIGNLSSGTYAVRVDTTTLPAGLTQTHDYTAPVNDHEGAVTLIAAEHNPNLDFGYRGSLNIGDVVWNDLDGSGTTQLTIIDGRVDINAGGTVDANDDGFIGTMRVIDGYLDINNSSSITTADDGTFQGLTVIDGAIDFDGSGTVTATDDGNRLFLPNLAIIDGRVDINAGGTVDNNDDGFIGSMRVVNGYLDINNDGSITATDDGAYQGYSVVNGRIDVNRSGDIFTNDDGTLYNDRPISGVRVYIDVNGNGAFDAATEPSATTDANGAYVIGNLHNATFTVRVDTTTLPANMVQTYDLTAPTTDSTATVTLSGANRRDVDFGYRDEASVGDYVWNDRDADGVQDAGEPPIAGVLVYLDADGDDTFDAGVERFDYTDANGAYLIGNLPPGSYAVRVDFSTLPAGATATYDLDGVGTLHEAARTLVVSEDARDVDFGYRSTASFGDRVWLDNGQGGGISGDGLQNGTEPGISGVRVYADMNGNGIYDSATEPAATTDVSGNYTIGNLLAGTYTARVDPSTLPAGRVQTYDLESPLDDAATFSLSAAQNRTDVDFGYVQPASLGDRTWNDANANGQQDGGEAGIDGVRVTLYRSSDNGIVATTTTSGGGAYLFSGILPGTYYVVFGDAPGYTRTVPDQGNDASDSDANAGTGRTANITLASGGSNNTLDAGYYRPVSIGNRVWLDENSDGLQDAGEPGLANVELRLYGSAGALVASTVTDPRGGYLFANLPPGVYYVDVLDGTGGQSSTLPFAGITQTPPSTLANADFGNQNHGTTAIPGGGGLTGYPVTAVAGGEYLTADFGYNHNPSPDVNTGTGTGTIGDRVWIDADGDGRQDDGEAGVGAVTLTLTTAGVDLLFGTADDVAVTTRQTDATGRYIFDGLAPGAYVVAVTASGAASHNVLAAGYTQTGDPDQFGVTATAPDHRTTIPIMLAPGDVFVNADFGYRNTGVSLGSVGDRVWLDADGDGVQDGGEAGIPGVTVALVRDLDNDGVRDSGEPVIAVVVTDASGNYLFSGLQIADGAGSDDYLVWVSDTDSVLQDKRPTFDLDGAAGGGGAGQANSVFGLSRVQDLGPTAVTNQDFGYAPSGHYPGDGLLGDRIWLDNGQGGGVSGDGLQNGTEPGIEGVRVELYDAAGTVLLTSTTTDENGIYGFGGLDATATYTVKVGAASLGAGGVLAGLTNTGDPDGGANSRSVVDLATSGGVNLNQDFGYVGTGSIGNLVWNDRDGDGSVGAGEPGLGGVTVDLYRDLDGDGMIDPGEPRVASTTTAANGSYAFAGLATDDGDGDADYVIDVTDTAGALAGWWHSLGTPGANNNSQTDPYAVALTPASPSNVTADFGYYVEGASVGNRVWYDVDGDGIQGVGEAAGVPNVQLRLTISYANNTTSVVYTVSDASGFYRFGNLMLDEDFVGAPGGSGQPLYSVSVGQFPAGWYPVPEGQGGNAWLDSGHVLGTPAVPTRGVNDVALRADPTTEVFAASFDFGASTSPTLAVITDFRAVTRDGKTWVQWRTGAEIGTLGYWLERLAADGWVAVNARMLPARLMQPLPRNYELADAGAAAGGTYTYRLVELENTGRRVVHGPYTVTVDGAGYGFDAWSAGIEWGGEAAGRGDDPDGDRLTNFEEFLAGTDPLAPDSVLRITHMRLRDGLVVLSWRSADGRVYAVEVGRRPNGPFLPVAGGLPATPPVNTFACPPGADGEPMYYRVIVSEP